jgi:uncharacterized protein
MSNQLKQLSQVIPSARILLLPHCLRQSNTCQARYNQQGLQCAACNPDCSVNRLRAAALEYGYKGVCVAPGGHLAIKYVQEKSPRAIVAVACEKELEEGVQGVKSLVKEKINPLIIIIPLTKNGCLDTEVDVEQALEIISTGCLETAGETKS